jgi:flagellar hook-basal body complex protein FliE
MATAIEAVKSKIADDAAAVRQFAPSPAVASDQGQRIDGFGSFFERAVHSVDAQDRAAADKMAAVDAGRSDDLVGAMLASQQASLSFSMLMQARNKVVGAMEDLIKLPL